MKLRRALARAGIPAAVAFLVLLPAAAHGSFHLNQIREVFPGSTAEADSAFVELQAYSGGQNLVSGRGITVYDALGSEQHSFTLPANVAGGESQRTVLIADASPPDAVTADFTDADLDASLASSGGAVCFDSLPADCVAWGNFTGEAALPTPGAGAPVAAAGIPDGSSITRSLARGCPTLLESVDDSDESSADFAVTADPTPRPNAVTPTEAPCVPPETTIISGPKQRTRSKRARFTFTASVAGAAFQCSLDGKPFRACSSPTRLRRIKKGRHRFAVRAVAGGTADSSPATYRWKRKRRRR